MTKINDYSILMTKIFQQICLLNIVLAVGAFLWGGYLALAGLLWGAVAGIVNFMMMSYRVKRCPEMLPDEAISYMRRGLVLRLIFALAMLFIALKILKINMLATVIGLLSLQIIIVIKTIVGFLRTLLTRRLF